MTYPRRHDSRPYNYSGVANAGVRRPLRSDPYRFRGARGFRHLEAALGARNAGGSRYAAGGAFRASPSGSRRTRASAERSRPSPRRRRGPAGEERWEGVAEKGVASAWSGLDAVAASDPNFDGKAFLNGARRAYELIVTAFAKGDRETLKPLLSQDVFDGFSCGHRAARAARRKHGDRRRRDRFGDGRRRPRH